MSLNTELKLLQNDLSESPDLNQTILQNDLKKVFHTMTDVKQFCKRELLKNPSESCTYKIRSYRKHLLGVTVTVAKANSTRISIAL